MIVSHHELFDILVYGITSHRDSGDDKRNIYILVSRVVRSVSPEVIPYETIFLFLRKNKRIEKPRCVWRAGLSTPQDTLHLRSGYDTLEKGTPALRAHN